MAADGQIVFEIKGDDTKAKQSINNVTEALKKAGNQWETEAGKSTDAVGDKFSSMFKKISVAALAMKAGKALLDFGKDAVQAASDLQEVQNVVDVTFGEGNRKIEEWAKNASTQFGLTELQAKKFASTMGAMMKSSGLAGDQIETMSTDLAGLAADMASFYNLDFETAFSKIRSGISGMTMPLKELGIDMSVDTMNAFALKQGLEKTFAQMSQAEQTVLRYQYLMQATADAQGDFARTSDGLANTQRRLEMAIDTLKTKMGEPLLGVIADATGALADFIGLLVPDEKKNTVLDDLNDIKIERDQKLADIQAIANKANDLLSTLNTLNAPSSVNQSSDVIGFLGGFAEKLTALGQATQNAGTIKSNVGDIAAAANDLGVLTGAKWQAFANALGDIGADAGSNLQGVANALGTKLGGDAEKWENLLKAIGGNAKAAIDAIGDNDGSKTKAFLANVAESADDLTTDYSTYWTKLLSALGNNAAGAIAALAGGEGAGAALGDIAEGANDLSVLAGTKWGSFIDALGGLTGKSDVPKTLSGVADALAKNIGGNASEWETLLKAVGDNLGTVTAAAVADNGQTAAFLDAAAEAAASLGGDYSTLWEDLMIALGTNAGAAVSALKDATGAGDNLASIANGANALTIGKSAMWSALLTTLTKVDGLENVFDSTSAGNVAALAAALSDNSPDTTQAEAWKTFLGALQTNPDALTALTKTSAEETAGWLERMAEAANSIDAGDAQAWAGLLGSFTEGLPGLNDTEYGSEFFEALKTNFLAMGSQSDVAAMGLAALGYSTEDIASLQNQWLIICQKLVKEMPSLNSIINTQTGEIEGGTQAVQDYIAEWKAAQEEAAFLEAVAKRRDALEEHYGDRYDKQANLALKRAEYERRLKDYNEMVRKVNSGEVEKTADLFAQMLNEKNWLSAAPQAIADMEAEYQAYMAEYQRAMEIAVEEEELAIAAYGADAVAKAKATEATEDLAQSMSTLSQAAEGNEEALASVKSAVTTLEDAMKALGDYQQKVREETASTLRQSITGFNEVISPATKARNEVDSLTAAIKAETDAEKKQALQRQLESAKKTAGESPSLQSMQRGLESQLRFMQDYNDQLAKARALGVSNEILASLSDGSQESYDYLYAINDAMKGLSDEERIAKIKELNETYKQVQTEAESFTNTLTDQKLTADEEFKSLVQNVQDAVGGLDMGETTYKYMEQTLQGIIDACGDKEAAIKTAVDGILAQMVRLSNMGYGANVGMLGNVRYRNSAVFSYSSASHANGMDYVPYDGYLALLHQGERIQTAAEADLSRRYANQQPGVDYAAAGAAMGAAMGRGNVYLDGRIVGDVIGSRQANSYRALERSGWQG